MNDTRRLFSQRRGIDFKSSSRKRAFYALLAGAYLIAGYAYFFKYQLWPPFWPPQKAAIMLLFWIRTEGDLFMAMFVFGLLFLLLGPVLVIWGILDLFMPSKQR
ncbi:MAG: hypothetical protein KGM99_11780 [Burkholderiales bacterium]|nr:hypothetical protein [Burkholderiales bacterium]